MIGITLSLNDYPRHSRSKSILKKVLYASAIGIVFMYIMFCTRMDKISTKSIPVLVLVFVMTLLFGGVSS